VGFEYVQSRALGTALYLFYNALCNKQCRALIGDTDLRRFLKEKLLPIIYITKRDIALLNENPIEFIKERDENSFWNDTDCLMIPKKEAMAVVRYLFCKKDKNVELLRELLSMCSSLLLSGDEIKIEASLSILESLCSAVQDDEVFQNNFEALL
jgi:hypothetical protein